MATYNVVKDYSWTSIPKGSKMREEAPRVYLRSFEFNQNQLLTKAQNYLEIIKGQDSDTFYKELYKDATEKRDDFILPYFGDNARQVSNVFGDSFSGGTQQGIANIGENINNLMDKWGGGAVSFFGQIKAAITNEPGSYIETPKFYQYDNTDTPLQISFMLSNTISEEDITKNYNLIYRLIEINRPNRQDAYIMQPPHIYKLRLHGWRYMEWAFCSGLGINMLGTRREINKRIIPEAYQVTMEMTSLTVETANFMRKLKGIGG